MLYVLIIIVALIVFGLPLAVKKSANQSGGYIDPVTDMTEAIGKLTQVKNNLDNLADDIADLAPSLPEVGETITNITTNINTAYTDFTTSLDKIKSNVSTNLEF